MGFRINRVYTRSGDTGETGLVGGKRVQKTDRRVRAYGEIDELNSFLGLLKEELTGPLANMLPVVVELQQQLFDLGSELATPHSGEYEGMWRVEARHVTQLEKWCDHFGEDLPELVSFVLPGGSRASALCHVARTVARRAEREIVSLSQSSLPDDRISPEAIRYVNRLSDLLFVLSRWCLKEEGRGEPLWIKEASRRG